MQTVPDGKAGSGTFSYQVVGEEYSAWEQVFLGIWTGWFYFTLVAIVLGAALILSLIIWAVVAWSKKCCPCCNRCCSCKKSGLVKVGIHPKEEGKPDR